MRKIRILYTIPNFDTAGSGKALLNIALGLDTAVFEPHIACLHDKGAFFETVRNSGIPIHVFDYLPKERPVLQMLSSCWKVSRKFKAIGPDIIHSFHYNSNYTEALAARMAGIKWTFTKKNMSWGGSSANSWKLRSFLAKKIIVQNKDMISAFYPDSKKTTLISRGVAVDRFLKSEASPEIRNKMQTQQDSRIIITVANLVPVKGIEILIDAFAILQGRFPDWILWIIGDYDNEYGQSLIRKTEELGLVQNVKFSGKQLNVADYLNHAEIFVLPTLDKGEGSPVALLEAMANGKVVLGSNAPGIKDQLENFPAHLFPSGDSNGLASRLGELMAKDTKDLADSGNGFHQLVTQNYTIWHEVEKHQEYYLSLL